VRGEVFVGSQPTTRPTKCDVLYDFRVLWKLTQERLGVRVSSCLPFFSITWLLWPRSARSKRDQSRFDLASALREFLQRADGFTWIGTYGVIRAHIGATNHPLLINDVACGHRQAKSVLAVELIQLVSELQINRLEVIGKCEYEAKLTRYLQPMVRQYIETQIEATMDRASVPLQLRRDCYQASS